MSFINATWCQPLQWRLYHNWRLISISPVLEIELIICWTSAANDQNSAYQNHLKRSTFLAGPGKKQTRKHPGQGRIYKTICALMSSLYYVCVYGLSCRDFRKKYVCFKFSVYLPVKINLFLHTSIHYNWRDFLKIW